MYSRTSASSGPVPAIVKTESGRLIFEFMLTMTFKSQIGLFRSTKRPTNIIRGVLGPSEVMESVDKSPPKYMTFTFL